MPASVNCTAIRFGVLHPVVGGSRHGAVGVGGDRQGHLVRQVGGHLVIAVVDDEHFVPYVALFGFDGQYGSR